MEVDGGMKQMQAMVKELTLDSSVPTIAVLGSRDGGGKLLVAVTENTVAAERVDASALIREIAPHISQVEVEADQLMLKQVDPMLMVLMHL